MLACLPLMACQGFSDYKKPPAPSLKLATWTSLTDDQKTISQLEDLLVLMQQLLEADPATHKNLDAQLRKQYETDPSDTNKMRLALALTTTGHSHADLLKSQQLIAEIQSETQPLAPVINIYLKTRITGSRNRFALEEKVKTLSSDKNDLNQELDDVKAQIKALTAIEQNLEKAKSGAGTH